MAHWMVNTVCGVMGLVGTATLIANVRRGMQSTETAAGTVLRIERSEDSDGVSFRPIVEFQHAGQTVVLDKLSGWPQRPKLAVGESVTVYFPADQPQLARLWRWSWPELAIPLIEATTGIGVLTWITLTGR
jgi:hypothetical protein